MNVFLFSFSESAKLVDQKIQRGLFLFAVSSSCVNPIVYGKIELAYVMANTQV